MDIEEMQKNGVEAVHMLRKTKLSLGLPFMINSYLLPLDQFYLEFADGSIKIARLCKQENDFKIVAELDAKEIAFLRKKYKLV